MKNIFLIVAFILITQTHSFSISPPITTSSDIFTTTFVPCTNLPVSGELVNNNSITTAIPNTTQLYMGFSGGSDARLRVYDIQPDSSMSFNEQIVLPSYSQQNAEKCSESSAVDFADDGSLIAYGCGNSDTYIYSFSSNQYTLKQILKVSYNKDGGKVIFSEDSHRLFTLKSMQEVNVFHQGANLFVLSQTIPVNLQGRTTFAMPRNARYFSTVERSEDDVYVALYGYSKEKLAYVKLHTESINYLVTEMFMNDRFIILVVGSSVSGCSTLAYKISQDGLTFSLDQQITQTPSGICIRSGYITTKNELLLTSQSQKTITYQYNSIKKFVKESEIVHNMVGPKIFTELRLIDTKYQHLIFYTNVGFSLYCPKVALK